MMQSVESGFQKQQKLIRIGTVKQLTGLARSTIYSYVEQGKFPKQVPLTDYSVAWVESEVSDWISDRIDRRNLRH